MSQTALPVFDSTLQTTNVWLHDIEERMEVPDSHRAYQALRAVLHALRDHLPVPEAAALGAQLPLLVRGVYYEGWHPGDKPLKDRSRDGFLTHIAAAYPGKPPTDPEWQAWAVFSVLAKHISTGEVEKVRHVLPVGIRELWL